MHDRTDTESLERLVGDWNQKRESASEANKELDRATNRAAKASAQLESAFERVKKRILAHAKHEGDDDERYFRLSDDSMVVARLKRRQHTGADADTVELTVVERIPMAETADTARRR